MHIPDGFVDAPTSLAAGVVAAGAVAVSLRKARHDALEARAPMTGLVAAFGSGQTFLGRACGAIVGHGANIPLGTRIPIGIDILLSM